MFRVILGVGSSRPSSKEQSEGAGSSASEEENSEDDSEEPTGFTCSHCSTTSISSGINLNLINLNHCRVQFQPPKIGRLSTKIRRAVMCAPSVGHTTRRRENCLQSHPPLLVVETPVTHRISLGLCRPMRRLLQQLEE